MDARIDYLSPWHVCMVILSSALIQPTNQKVVRRKVRQTTVFQTYPDELAGSNRLKRRYMELRGAELSFYKPAKGGAIQAIRSGFMETQDVQKVRRLKCWDAPENQRFQVWFLMKFAGGEHVKFCFGDERSVDEWAVAVGQMADVAPSPWEHLGDDPDQEYTEEVVEVKAHDEVSESVSQWVREERGT